MLGSWVKMDTLNVGCGYRRSDFHYVNRSENIIHVDVNVSKFNKRFIHVQCDGQHLPFKNDCFDKVFSRLVIENVDAPTLFLAEQLRVAREEVVVIAPHRLCRLRKPSHEKHKFNIAWFHGTLQNFVHTVSLEFGLFRLDTNLPVPITVPKFIVVRILKNGY